jgi:hypothetical protein
MSRRIVRLAVPALVLLPAFPSAIGGWAITIVDDLPDYAVAGELLALIFSVRQHGVQPLEKLKPRIEVLGRGERRTYTAVGIGSLGRYTTAFTLPRAGDWIITIHSGFGESRTTLMPLTAITRGSPAPPALSEAERGRRLFAAKGCLTCHVELRAGPDLFSKRYTKEYVSQVLADPERVFAGRQGTLRMPNLNLNAREIGALAAYLGANKGVAAR